MIPDVLHSDKMYGEKDRKHQPCSCDPTLSLFLSMVKCKMKEIVLLLRDFCRKKELPILTIE